LATQFSQDQSAPDGGDLGWMRLDEMDPALADLVQKSDVNQLIGPVLGIGGYYIAVLHEKRAMAGGIATAGNVALRRILWALPPDAAESEVQKATTEARNVAAGIRSCDDMQKAAASAPASSYSDLGTLSISQLTGDVQSSAINQPI